MFAPPSATLQLVFVRHGETEWTEKGLLHGRLDSPLSPAGIIHAKLTADRLRDERFDALYTSPLGRAMQTAAILGEPLGLSPVPLEGLREMDFGWVEGKPLYLLEPNGAGPRLRRYFARLAMAMTVERPKRFAVRVGAALDWLCQTHPKGRLLIVTHFAVLNMIMALIVDGNPGRWRKFGPWAACGITEIQAVNGCWKITCLNDQAHIQGQNG